jgi:hypothetical protein
MFPHFWNIHILSFNEFQKRLNQLFGAKLTIQIFFDYFDNYFEIMSGFLKRGANFHGWATPLCTGAYPGCITFDLKKPCPFG